MKNWKTTVAGIVVAGIAVATALGYLTAQQATAIGAAATSLGLIVAKDNNVTGV